MAQKVDPSIKATAVATTAVAITNAANGVLVLAAGQRSRVKLVNPPNNTLRFYFIIASATLSTALFQDYLDPGDSWDSKDEDYIPTEAIRALASGAGPENIMCSVYT